MLQNIRERFTGKFALVILALICLPFLFFGIPSDFIATDYVAKVNDNEISQPFFENSYRNELLRYDSQGVEVPDAARSIVRENVLNTIISNLLVDLYIDEKSLQITDAFVTDIIQSSPEFLINGKFSKDVYYSWLNERVLEPAQFEESQRISMKKSQLERGLRATSFVTPSEYRRYLNLVGEQREVTIAEIDLSVLAEPIELIDEDIETYYSLRQNEFMQPESIDFEYIEINKNTTDETITVSEDEIREYFEDAGERFARDERRQASHILFLFGDNEITSEQKAQEALNKLNEGEDFSALALQYSDDGGTKEQGGNLGMLAKSQLPGALGDAIFAMSINEVSELVRTDFGFHIVQLNNIESDGQVPFETVRAELEMELKSQKSSVNFTVIERELSDALFDADDIEVIARDLNFDLNELKGFTRDGGGEFGANQIVIDALFNAQRNNDSQLSDIIEVDANRSIVFQVSNFNEAIVMPLDQVRDQIISDMKFVSAEVLASNIATKISSLMENNEDLVPTVEELDSVTVRDVIINRLTDDVDFVIQANVFGMKKPLPGDTKVGTVVMQNSNYAVFSLKNHTYGIPEMIPQDERDAAKERLNQQSGVSDYTAFISELQLNAAIEKNEELLNAASMFD
ncbi:SurA N-terminal domain-containing protein [Woeseiaceae bacterium]|nr:SurA N-terminal domain-containing protein [Woeseiaceae bacterium]